MSHCLNIEDAHFSVQIFVLQSNHMNTRSLCVSGESVTVTVCATEQGTAALLATVLDGDRTAASLLARAIHQDPATFDAGTEGLTVPLSPSELGIWIDPIGERSCILSPALNFCPTFRSQ